jgi:cytochrome c oxidase assembly protein subunit 11
MSQPHPSRPPLTQQQRRNRLIGGGVALVFVAMVGAAYAAVPLYKAFCQATGYDGTVRRAYQAPDQVLDHQVLVRFDVNVRDLPWDFTAEQTSQPVKIGETKVALFKVTNHADHPITGRAVFNVVPEQSAVYFHKLSCFCFSDQTIGPHQTVEMPVLYFIDPKWMNDFETRSQKDVTLSYTFYPAVDAKPQGVTAARTSTKVGG